MDAFKALHILSMFSAVTLLVGIEVFIGLAIWRRDVHGLATVYRLTRRPNLTNIGLLLLFAGVVFGLLTAAIGGFDFFAGWLVAAYLLVAALVLANLSPPKQRVRRAVLEAVEAEQGRRSLEEVTAELEHVPVRTYLAVNLILFTALIADMVLKPF